MSMICDHEYATRYVAGTLTADELADFEVHLLACARCQAAVRDAAIIRTALTSRHGRKRYALAGIPIGLAAAAAIAWLIMAPSPLQRLGRIHVAPGLTAMPVRAAEDSAAVFAERGIAAYEKREFGTAARWLSAAESLQPQPGVAFFHGAAQLMLHHPDSAVAAFRRVIAAGASAYENEAHYYAAKAWLQLGNADSALVDLEAASTAAARVLADSVKRVR